MGSFLRSLLLLVFLPALCSAQNEIKERFALVIGIQTYQHVSPLKNTLNDAQDMAAALKSKGFQVVELYEPKDRKAIIESIRSYYELIKGRKSAAGLIYYSGHGIQIDGSNYLIPTSANLQMRADVDDQCVRMDFVMQALEEAGNPLNILILDACRNNPFRSFSRSSAGGLNMVDAPKGSYIVYATKPGAVASDGTGRNGLFTSKLLKHINEPDLNIEQVFKRVARDVSNESAETQRPWIASDYTGDFYFSNAGSVSPSPSSAESTPVTNTSNSRDVEMNADALFQKGSDLLKASKHKESVDAFLESARLGYAPAQVAAGNAFYHGLGIEKDYQQAFKWYSEAATQNHTEAQYLAGTMYYNGEGVNEDYPKAAEWFAKSASSHHGESQYMLGLMYTKGRGVTKDAALGLQYYIQAGNNNHIKSQNYLGEIYLMGNDVVRQNQKEAIRWFRKAAALGDDWAKQTLKGLGEKY
jgi:TPR repeat protein